MRKLFAFFVFILFISITSFAQNQETESNEADSISNNLDSVVNNLTQDSIKKAEQKAKIDRIKKENRREEGSEVNTESQRNSQKETVEKDSLEYYRKAYLDATTPKYPPGVIYGQEFFRNGDFKFFQKADDARVPENYTIGPGDEFGIQVYGFSDFKGTYKVGSDGAIYAKELGKIFLKGLTFEEAKRVISQRLGSTYNTENSGVSITLNYARTILVHISGEVFKPGSYVIPAINSAFNALVAVGGPTDIGSVRNIYIKRDGKIIDTVDAYDILFNPVKSKEIFLQNNDYLIVPVAIKTIRIGGAVRKPNVFELKKYEGLNSLISFAGGLTNSMYGKSVLVKRLAGDKILNITVNYDSLKLINKDFSLFTGDEVYFRNYTAKQYNLVTIHGAVEVPGEYEWKENLQISDLVKNAGGLHLDAYLEKGYVLRSNPNLTVTYIPFNVSNAINLEKSIDNIILNKKDIVYINGKTDFFNPYNVTILGEVRKPGTFPSANLLKVSDLLFLAGNLKPEAYLDKAIILRTNDDLSKTSITVNLKRILEDTSSTENIILFKKDVLTVFNFSSFQDTYQFTIEGALRKPGTFEFSENTRITDLILMAGGLKLDEYVKEIVHVTRINREDYSLSYLRFNLQGILDAPQSDDNILLQKGDVVRVLNKREFLQDYKIAIYGAVKTPGSMPFGYNLTLRDVLLMAGGFTQEAENGRIEISRVMTISTISGVPESVKHQVDTFHIERNLLINATTGVYVLMPSDEIFVRTRRGFSKQRHVYLGGEVAYPGVYAIGDKSTTITDVIKRAGGVTQYSLVKGSTLFRTYENPGKVYFNLKRAMKRPWSHYNYYMEEGDSIFVPKMTDLIFITGALKFENSLRFQGDTMDEATFRIDKINAPYVFGRSAKFYIRNFTGGFSKYSMRRKTIVITADGKVRKTYDFLLFKIYPKVSLGSKIVVKPNQRKINRDTIVKLKQKKKILQLTPNAKGRISIASAEDYYKTAMERITQVLSIVLLAKTALK